MQEVFSALAERTEPELLNATEPELLADVSNSAMSTRFNFTCVWTTLETVEKILRNDVLTTLLILLSRFFRKGVEVLLLEHSDVSWSKTTL